MSVYDNITDNREDAILHVPMCCVILMSPACSCFHTNFLTPKISVILYITDALENALLNPFPSTPF